MHLAGFIKSIKSDAVRRLILKLLFRKNGLKLSSFKSYRDDRFFIYCVDGTYIAFESLNWFVSPKELERRCHNMSLYAYKPSPGDTIVDIGAGLGEEAIVYATLVGPAGRVVAVEANPIVFSVLSTALRLNGSRQVETLNVALSNTTGLVTINDTGGSYQGGSLQASADSLSTYDVPGMHLSALMHTHGLDRIDLLKVNIEGAERFLTEEPAPDIYKRIRHIAIECHDFRYRAEGLEFFKTRQLIIDYFRAQGYKLQYQATGTPDLDDWIYGSRQD